jgi:hypothetical protein
MTDPELPAPMDWISPEEVEQCEQALAAAMLATLDAEVVRREQVQRLIENGRPDPRTFPTWAELTGKES